MMEWTVHYFDQRLNRKEVSRAFSSEDDAQRHACDLMVSGMMVNYMVNADGDRTGPAELMAWCKKHRTPETPRSPQGQRQGGPF